MSIQTQIERSSIAAASEKIKDANSIIPPNQQWRLYITGLIISDGVMTFLAFWLAYYLRFEWFVQYFNSPATVSFERYRLVLFTTPLLWLVIFMGNGLYVKENLLGGTREYSRVLRSASAGFLVIVLAGFLEPTLIIARGWLLLTWGISFLIGSHDDRGRKEISTFAKAIHISSQPKAGSNYKKEGNPPGQ